MSLSPAMSAELDTAIQDAMVAGSAPDGWIHHSGSMPGYQTFAGYNHDAGVVLVVAINTDATAYVQGKAFAPLDLVVEAVTTTVTPETPFTVTPM